MPAGPAARSARRPRPSCPEPSAATERVAQPDGWPAQHCRSQDRWNLMEPNRRDRHPQTIASFGRSGVFAGDIGIRAPRPGPPARGT